MTINPVFLYIILVCRLYVTPLEPGRNSHEYVSSGLRITAQLSDHLLALFLPGPRAHAIDIQQESQHLTVLSVTMVTMDLLCGEILAAKQSNLFHMNP